MMPLAGEHLVDIETRLKAAATAAGDNIYRSRVANLPAERLPAICCYGPKMSLQPIGSGQPKYLITHTLAIEGRVMQADGYDTAAGTLTQQVLAALFQDADWVGRWKETPAIEVDQFLSNDGEQPFCGEVITLICIDAATTEFPPAPQGPEITGIDIAVDIVDNDGPDGTAEAEVTIDNPAI